MLSYVDSVLRLLASAMGRPVKMDFNTTNYAKRKFARMYVEVDLTKPMVGKMGLGGDWYNVEYEGPHMLCSKCGCYGHFSRDCGHVDGKTRASGQPTVATIEKGQVDGV